MKISEIKEFVTVKLKEGREGDVMEIFPNGAFVIDIGDSPASWDTLYDKTINDIEKVIKQNAKGETGKDGND